MISYLIKQKIMIEWFCINEKNINLKNVRCDYKSTMCPKTILHRHSKKKNQYSQCNII